MRPILFITERKGYKGCSRTICSDRIIWPLRKPALQAAPSLDSIRSVEVPFGPLRHYDLRFDSEYDYSWESPVNGC